MCQEKFDLNLFIFEMKILFVFMGFWQLEVLIGTPLTATYM